MSFIHRCRYPRALLQQYQDRYRHDLRRQLQQSGNYDLEMALEHSDRRGIRMSGFAWPWSFLIIATGELLETALAAHHTGGLAPCCVLAFGNRYRSAMDGRKNRIKQSEVVFMGDR